MWSNVKKKLIELSGLLLLDYVYFLWMPYPRSILNISENTLGGQVYASRLLFYVFYFMWITHFCPQDQVLKQLLKSGKRPAWVFSALQMGIYMVIRIVFDLLVLVAAKSVKTLPTTMFCITDTLFTVAIFYIRNYSSNTNKEKRPLWSIALMIGCIAILIVLFFKAMNLDQETANYSAKYVVSSNVFSAYEQNVDLQKQYIFILWAMATHLLVIFGSRLANPSRNETKIPANQKKSVLLIRDGSLLVLLILIVMIKPLLLNVSYLNARENTSSLRSNKLSEIRYYKEMNATYLYRIDEQGKAKETYRRTSPTILKKQDLVLAEVISPLMYTFEEVEAGGSKAVYYGPLVVLLIKDEEIEVLKKEDIPSQPYNEQLVQFLHEMIRAGDFEWYENGLAYLQKYDTSFINAYIERYATENFYSYETENSWHVHTTYIRDISVDALKAAQSNQ